MILTLFSIALGIVNWFIWRPTAATLRKPAQLYGFIFFGLMAVAGLVSWPVIIGVAVLTLTYLTWRLRHS